MRRVITPTDERELCRLEQEKRTPPQVLLAEAQKPPAQEGGFGFDESTSSNPQRAPDPVSVPPADNYLAAVSKLVPAEIIGAFLTIDALVRTSQGTTNEIKAPLYFGITAAIMLITPFYFVRTMRDPRLPIPWAQVIIVTISFVVWVYAIGGPFQLAGKPYYNPLYSAILLPLYTLVAPLFLTRK